MRFTSLIRAAASVLGLAAIAFTVYQSGILEHFSVAELRMYIEEAGVWAPLHYIATYAVATVLFVPGAPITLLGGALFGPYLGTLYTVLGASLGATAAFFFARLLGRQFFSTMLASERFARLKEFDEGLETRGFLTTLIVRLIPLFPFNALNYALGLTAVKPLAYVLATIIGIIPGTFAYTYFGDSLAMLNPVNISIAVVIMVGISLFGHIILKRYGHQN